MLGNEEQLRTHRDTVTSANIYGYSEGTQQSCKNFMCINSLNCHNNAIGWIQLLPILLIGRLRHRPVSHFAQGHIVGKW